MRRRIVWVQRNRASVFAFSGAPVPIVIELHVREGSVARKVRGNLGGGDALPQQQVGRPLVVLVAQFLFVAGHAEKFGANRPAAPALNNSAGQTRPPPQLLPRRERIDRLSLIGEN